MTCVAIPGTGARPDGVTGAPTPEGLAQTLAAVMRDNAIISDESVSYGRGFYKNTHPAPAHDWLHLVGGAIGAGMPTATGAALGCAGQRRVINLHADGSAMYSLQALWPQARERPPVTTLLLNNRKYGILIGEYQAVGATPGPVAMSMLDLSNPNLDWVKLSDGMGVEAGRVTTVQARADLMKHSFRQTGPFLIELI